jgi:hypothetical protein
MTVLYVSWEEIRPVIPVNQYNPFRAAENVNVIIIAAGDSPWAIIKGFQLVVPLPYTQYLVTESIDF